MENTEHEANNIIPTISDAKPKAGKGSKIAMVILSVVAICGVGFGVYEYLQVSQRDKEISTLKTQIQVADTIPTTNTPAKNTETAMADESPFRNAIITSNSTSVLTELFESDDYYSEGRSILISVQDGGISGCTIVQPAASGYGKTVVGDCSITGISGKISAVSKMGNTQMTWPYVGFLLEDGSVEYISTGDLIDKLNASVKGKLTFKSNQPVTNIVSDISVRSSNPEVPGGHRSTAFFHLDGSFTLFDESMLAE